MTKCIFSSGRNDGVLAHCAHGIFPRLGGQEHRILAELTGFQPRGHHVFTAIKADLSRIEEAEAATP